MQSITATENWVNRTTSRKMKGVRENVLDAPELSKSTEQSALLRNMQIKSRISQMDEYHELFLIFVPFVLFVLFVIPGLSGLDVSP